MLSKCQLSPLDPEHCKWYALPSVATWQLPLPRPGKKQFPIMMENLPDEFKLPPFEVLRAYCSFPLCSFRRITNSQVMENQLPAFQPVCPGARGSTTIDEQDASEDEDDETEEDVRQRVLLRIIALNSPIRENEVVNLFQKDYVDWGSEYASLIRNDLEYLVNHDCIVCSNGHFSLA